MKHYTGMRVTNDKWERRRRNLAALIAYKRMNASSVSKKAGLSINTLSKFLRGETKSISWNTLERICEVLDIPNAAVLDADNPFSDTKFRLYALVVQMSEEEAREELERILSK